MAQTTPAGATGETAFDIRHVLPILASVMLGILLSALDQTIVGTAMPRVIADLGGLNHYAWVFTAYMLTSTVTVPIYGKLSDIYGRRIFYAGGMVVFLIGSALSGASQDMNQLILFRAVQGLGAGAMMPIAFAIIGDVFPPAERGKWQGLTSGMWGLASIVGPFLGGWLTDNLGWRWVFYVNMPVGAIAVLAAILGLPKMASGRRHSIDWTGAGLLVAGTVPLLLAFSWAGTEYAWGSAVVIGLIVLSLVVLALFTYLEFRAPEPIIAPSLFRNSIFTVSMLASFLIAGGMFGATMYLPLFVQAVLGNSATNSGVVLIPMMLGFVTSSIVGGQMMSRTGRYKMLALGSLVVAVLGMFLFTRMTITTSEGAVVRNMILCGLGIGTTMSLFTIVVQNAFPIQRLGEVTAALQFFRSIGGTLGVAVLGSVMTSQFQNDFFGNLPESVKQAVPAPQLDQLANPQLLLSADALDQVKAGFASFGPQGAQLFDQIFLAIRQALASAITELFLIGTIFMIGALAVTVLLREIPLRRSLVEHVGVGAAEGAPLPGEQHAAEEAEQTVLARVSTTEPGAD